MSSFPDSRKSGFDKALLTVKRCNKRETTNRLYIK